MPPIMLESVDRLRDFVGQEIAKSDWFTVTQDTINAFADVTGDKQWIHLDVGRAQRESPYGTTVAHGFLTLSLLSQMFASAIQVKDVARSINYGLNRVRFPSPVPAGARVRASFSVQAFNPVTNGSEVTFSVVIECENSAKPCCVAEWILHHYR